MDFRRAGDTCLLALHGDLDIATAGTLGTALADAIASVPPLGVVVVDLDGVVFCGARGLGTLLDGAADTVGRGGRFVLARRPSTVRRLMDLLGVDSRPHPLLRPADGNAVELLPRVAGPDPALR